MKKFSNKINENDNTKAFEYTINIKLHGIMTAVDISTAGELVGQEVDEITKDKDLINFEIESIDEIDMDKDFSESLNDIESITNNTVDSILNEITEKLNTVYNPTIKQEIISKIIQKLS